MGGGFAADGERQLDDPAGLAALGRRQDAQGGQHRRCRGVGLLAAQHGAGGRPVGQAGARKPIPRSRRSMLCSWRDSRIRLQLLPPKPKELLRAWRTVAALPAAGNRAAWPGRDSAYPGCRAEAVAQRQGADHRFDRAGGAQRVAGGALGRTARHGVAEQRSDRLALGGIVGRRGGAVQVDVADVGGCQAGRAQRASMASRAPALPVRRGHMVGVARFAGAEQQDRTGCRIARPFEQREGCLRPPKCRCAPRRRAGMAGPRSVAARRSRTAWSGTAYRHRRRWLRRCCPVRAGGQRRQRSGARRAGRRNRHRHALEAEIVAGEFGQRKGIVRRAVVEIVGQRAALRIAAAVGQFGLQDAGRAGAEEDADPRLAVAGNGRRRSAKPSVSRPSASGGCCGSRNEPGLPAVVRYPPPALHRSRWRAQPFPKAQGSRPLRPFVECLGAGSKAPSGWSWRCGTETTGSRFGVRDRVTAPGNLQRAWVNRPRTKEAASPERCRKASVRSPVVAGGSLAIRAKSISAIGSSAGWRAATRAAQPARRFIWCHVGGDREKSCREYPAGSAPSGEPATALKPLFTAILFIVHLYTVVQLHDDDQMNLCWLGGLSDS